MTSSFVVGAWGMAVELLLNGCVAAILCQLKHIAIVSTVGLTGFVPLVTASIYGRFSALYVNDSLPFMFSDCWSLGHYPAQ